MISAPSHRQLLSGNKLFLIILLIIGISSCASGKKVSSAAAVEVVSINQSKPKEDSVVKKPVTFDLETEESVTPSKSNTLPINTSTVVKVENELKDRAYNIAVVLPFNLDQVPLGQYADDTTKVLAVDSRNAVEFYLGCQMAKEKFSGKQLVANVYFLDDKNDSAALEHVFTQKPFPAIDYVVGPMSYDQMPIAAALAKKHQIPVISPLVSSVYLKQNPYFFNATPSFRAQYVFLLKQIRKQYPQLPIEVVYDGTDSLAESVDLLKATIQSEGFSGIGYKSVDATDDVVKLMATADTSSQRIVLLYSNKGAYIKTLVTKLKSIKNPLFVYTSSAAKSVKGLVDTKYPHDVFVAYPYSSGSLNYKIFATLFEEKYERKPTEIAHQAYDIMLHLFNLLDKKQAFPAAVRLPQIDFDNTQSGFDFQPVYNKNGGVDYYDNSFMYLLKAENGVMVEVK